MRHREFELRTGASRVSDITATVAEFARDCAGDGLLHVFLPHATAGIALLETGAGSDDDLAGHLDALLPRDARWRHAHGSAGHGADHVLPALISPSLVLPVDDGVPALGTWQSVVVVDTNVDNEVRRVRLSFVG